MKIQCQEPWFSLIVQGHKTIEGKIGKYEDYSQYINNYITITNGVEQIVVKLLKVVHYPNLNAYLEECWDKCAPHVSSSKEAKREYLNIIHPTQKIQVFSDERIKDKGGICALYIKLNKFNSLSCNQNI